MHPPHCTDLMRALHARREALTPHEVARTLADAPAVRAVALGARRECAALAPLALVTERLACAAAGALALAARDTPWRRWLAAQALLCADGLTAEDPRAWRAEPTLPSPFEQSLAAAVGIRDGAAPVFLRAFHAVPRDERAPLHRLLEGALTPGPPVARARRGEAEAALALLRRLLAGLRRGAD